MRFRYKRQLVHSEQYDTSGDSESYSLYTEIHFKRFRSNEIRLYIDFEGLKIVNCIVYSLKTSIVISIALRQFTRMNLLITPNTETTESTERMSAAK